MTEFGDPTAGERRRRLIGIKLTALVTEHLGTAPDGGSHAFGAGAGLVHDGGSWVLVDGAADRSLGASLAWAIRNGPASLDLVAEAGGGLIARRAAAFDFPIRVWFPEERSLLPVVADPLEAPRDPDPEHLALVGLIEEAGAVPHIERGVVTGEVRGLEVCRVVDEPTRGNFAELADVPTGHADPDAEQIAARLAARDDDGVLLEVGVGANDREAFQLLHGHRPTVEALSGVVSAVSDHRRVEARQHPLNRMAPERFLRWQVERDPGMLGLASLVHLDPPVDRLSMKHTEPCAALGVDRAGDSALVVFSVGVDLDLVAFVADVLAHLEDPVERVLVALPERDLLPIVHDLFALMSRPIELVGIVVSST